MGAREREGEALFEWEKTGTSNLRGPQLFAWMEGASSSAF